MAKFEDQREDERVQKGNSSDTLLAIYILYVLKNYSSPAAPQSAQQVLDHLIDEGYIDSNENRDAQRKKVRRYLDTLHECYGRDCVVKIEGKTRRDGNGWYYDVSRDKLAAVKQQTHETLSNEELEFIIDIIASSKIISSECTYGIMKKLLQKTDFPKEKQEQKWRALHREEWPKSINQELIQRRDAVQACMDDYRRVLFDYDGGSVLATPHGWDSQNGQYALIAKVEGQGVGEFTSFLLEKIQNVTKADADYDFDDTYYDKRFRKPEDEISLDSLFANIRKIKDAIKDNDRVEFSYLSYVIENERVTLGKKTRRVLPHSLVFTDGKYYLIGLDEDATEKDKKIGYYRVDLISQLGAFKSDKKLSDWDKYMFESIQRERAVEMHPSMLAGRDTPITFKVVESALDRVIDAFAKRPDELPVTRETRAVRNSSGEESHEERIVRVDVRTTYEEAFRWALANADAVEVTTQDVRDKIARIADPIYRLYTQTLPDKVRENLDYISETGIFRIARSVDEDTAYATFRELDKRKNISAVDDIFVRMESGSPAAYLGDFTDATSLRLNFLPECEDASWASKLTNVQSIEILDTQIDDVSWLKEMKRLIHLKISDSPVSDLSMLDEHTDIASVYLCNTNVEDISFIERYRKLDWITLIGCPIQDYSPLLRIPGYLKSLDVDEQTAQMIDMDKIRERHIGITIVIHNQDWLWGAWE